jgi:hypothetical protein
MGKDLRRYAKQTNARLILGGLLLIFIVGDGLIYLFMGREAATLGFLCLVAGLTPVLLIWLILTGLAWVATKVDEG